MSELKECTSDINGDMMEVECGDYYRIDEADKVIAEKDAEISELKELFNYECKIKIEEI